MFETWYRYEYGCFSNNALYFIPMNKNSMDTAANLFRPLITRDRTNLDLPLLLKELQVMLVLLLVSTYAITTPSFKLCYYYSDPKTCYKCPWLQVSQILLPWLSLLLSKILHKEKRFIDFTAGANLRRIDTRIWSSHYLLNVKPNNIEVRSPLMNTHWRWKLYASECMKLLTG